MRELLGEAPSTNVLAFPDNAGAVSENRPFMLVTYASKDGVRAVVE